MPSPAPFICQPKRMTLTVLFDLDDTLLENDIERFVPEYLKALGKRLDMVPFEKMAQELMAGTAKMAVKSCPRDTLEEVFTAHFYPAIGVAQADVKDIVTDFYINDFPALQYLTQPRPEAMRLVEYCFQQGFEVVIATNPLFPRQATLHRLAWAGLPVERYPFALVSTYEDFHFAKPNLAYFTEVLAQTGWNSRRAVMVGNDLEMDLKAAAALGMPTYLVTPRLQKMPAEMHPLSSQGALEGVREWLETMEAADFELELKTPAALMAILASTPAALDSLARHLPAPAWVRQPQPGEWCFTEILCHLRDVDAGVQFPRLEQVLKEENPFVPGVDSDAWANERVYIRQDGKASLQDFMTIRMRTLDLLKTLKPEDWQRPARHAIFGPTTLQELVSFTAIHDQNHIRQARKAVAE